MSSPVSLVWRGRGQAGGDWRAISLDHALGGAYTPMHENCAGWSIVGSRQTNGRSSCGVPSRRCICAERLVSLSPRLLASAGDDRVRKAPSQRPVGHDLGTQHCQRNGICTGTSRVSSQAVSYTHLRAHETKANLVCRLLLEKKKHK